MTSNDTIQTVAISGAGGLVGSALGDVLQQQNRSVVAISRSDGGSYQDTIRWDPYSGLTNPARLESVDAIVHLAGESIASGRWNERLKQKIRSSRIEGTRNLVQSIAAIEKRPKVFVCASAIGYYGDKGDRELDESAPAGEGFLADVCQQWEEEAQKATDLGVRVVNVRIAMVLSPKGGALQKMLLPFKLGLGGVVGSGKQYWSWIGLHDLARVLNFCVMNENISGPVNASSPEPVTNYEFTKTLGTVLHRPTAFPVPAPLARLGLGEMADALLLSSTRVIPAELKKHGFEFQHPGLHDALAYELQHGRS